MKKDSADEELLISKLENILNTINEWLRYADQKLAGMTVLNGGILWGYTRYLRGVDFTIGTIEIINFIGYFLVISSLFLCVIGMLPVLSKVWFLKKNKSNSDNALYFEHIQKYHLHDYVKLLSSKLKIEITQYSYYANDIAGQIITNSEITTVKFQRIKLASWLTLLGSIAFIIAILITYFQG